MTGLRDLTRSRDGYRWVRLNIFRTHFGVDESYDSVMSSPGWDIRRRRRPRPMYTDDEMYTLVRFSRLGGDESGRDIDLNMIERHATRLPRRSPCEWFSP